MAAPDERCVTCGVPLTPATTYLTQHGPVCWPCFERAKTLQEEADRRQAQRDAHLSRRAKTLGRTHGVMWGASVIASAGWAHLPGWVSSALLLATLALVIGLVTRRRWAYPLALALDASAAIALEAWGLLGIGPREGWPVALVAVFPLSLLALTRAARAAFESDVDPALQRRSRWPRWAVPALAAAGLGAGGAYLARRPHPDPARELMRSALPAWQTERGLPGSVAAGPAARALFAQAQRWPPLVPAFQTLDRVWPDEPAVREAVTSINRALADARLPYFSDVWQVAGRPIVLSYVLSARVPWRIGARTVDVLRLRRLDELNIAFGLYGATNEGLPVVMLDRVEATLAEELPVLHGHDPGPRSSPLNDFDRAALARLRPVLEARLGPGLAPAAAALAERERLLEEMRSRLHGGQVQLDAPDGFVLGDAWLESVEPQTRLSHPGGPLVLDTDLKAVARADEKLREPATRQLLGAAVDLMARLTEAHEARHALDETDPVGPPPPALFDVMPDSSTPFIAMADKELRAYLGELHDSELPACAALALVMRLVHGRGAGRTPHFFATETILEQLDPHSALEPAARLARLCSLPDAELRQRLADAWQKLYGAPMPPGQRAAAP